MILDTLGKLVVSTYGMFVPKSRKCREITIFDKIDSAEPIRQNSPPDSQNVHENLTLGTGIVSPVNWLLIARLFHFVDLGVG